MHTSSHAPGDFSRLVSFAPPPEIKGAVSTDFDTHGTTVAVSQDPGTRQFFVEKLSWGLRVTVESMPGLRLTVSLSTTLIRLQLFFALLVGRTTLQLIIIVEHAQRRRRTFFKLWLHLRKEVCQRPEYGGFPGKYQQSLDVS